MYIYIYMHIYTYLKYVYVYIFQDREIKKNIKILQQQNIFKDNMYNLMNKL